MTRQQSKLTASRNLRVKKIILHVRLFMTLWGAQYRAIFFFDARFMTNLRKWPMNLVHRLFDRLLMIAEVASIHGLVLHKDLGSAHLLLSPLPLPLLPRAPRPPQQRLQIAAWALSGNPRMSMRFYVMIHCCRWRWHWLLWDSMCGSRVQNWLCNIGGRCLCLYKGWAEFIGWVEVELYSLRNLPLFLFFDPTDCGLLAGPLSWSM